MARLIALTTLMAILALASPAHAVKPTTTNSKSIADANEPGKKKTKPAKQSAKSDLVLERNAMQLVNAHLPELKKLLENLRKDNPRQFDAAIRDLAKSAKRLQSVKNRDEELFEIEVELLQTKSNVKLLTAKLKVRDSQSDRDLLRQAAKRLHDAELAKAKYHVRYTKQRFEKAKQQLDVANKRLESIEGQSESRLEKTYLNFLKDAGRQKKP